MENKKNLHSIQLQENEVNLASQQNNLENNQIQIVTYNQISSQKQITVQQSQEKNDSKKKIIIIAIIAVLLIALIVGLSVGLTLNKSNTRQSEQLPQDRLIWIDCDTGIDDTFALFMAFYHPKLRIVGISTIFGNHDVETTTMNTLKLLKFVNKQNVDVYQGQDVSLDGKGVDPNDQFNGGKGKLGGFTLPDTEQKPIKDDNIYAKIYKTIKDTSTSEKRKITFVSIGPETNLAQLLTKFPDVKEYIDLISIMGGAVNQGNYSPSAEFNIYLDPKAAKIVFGSGIQIFLAPLELTYKSVIDDQLIAKVKSIGGNFATNAASGLQFFKDSYRKFSNIDVGYLNDPVPIYYLINPDAFKVKQVNVEIETQSEFCQGRTVVDLNGITQGPKNVILGLDVDLVQYWKEMMAALDICNKNSLKLI